MDGIPSSIGILLDPNSGNGRHGSSSSLFPYINYLVGEVTQQPMRWVYQWEKPKYYQMLVDSGSMTYAWTVQTWAEYNNAQLMCEQVIMLLSLE
jgi:hypothetical protein